MVLPRLEAPRDLTMPRGDSTTVRTLYSAALISALRAAAALGGSSPTVLAFRRAALPALTADRALFAASMRQPSRLTLARCLAHAGDASPVSRRAWADELAALLLLDVAEAGGLAERVDVDAAPPSLVRERAAIVYVAPRASTWSLDAAGITFRGGGASAEVGFALDARHASATLAPLGGTAQTASVPLFAQTRLLLHDNNPLAETEAHPDKSGSRVDLGGKSVASWAAALSGAHAVLREHLPEIAAEMDLFLRHVGPVGYDAEKHLSASYLEASGVVYVSLHPHRMTLAEALVHEFQHNKLNLLLGVDPVLENGFSPLFASPVRPDPRPLRGVLLAVHAFLPLAQLYARMARAASASERAWLLQRGAEVRALCREGCDVLLPHALPTALGAPLLAEITALVTASG